MWTSYIAIGDSLTEGYGDPAGGLEIRGWTDLVAERLDALRPGLTYRNLGRRGTSTADVLRSQLPIVLAVRPGLVSVTVGANDTRLPGWAPDRFTAELERLLGAIAGTGAGIVTLAYPDVGSAVAADGRTPSGWRTLVSRLLTVNEIVRGVSARFDACLLDLERLAIAGDPRLLSADLVHPNAIGYRRAADEAYRILAERFALPAPDARPGSRRAPEGPSP